MLEQIEKIIIIVGCQRSGTTLLGQIMGAPEHALLLDESDIISIQEKGGYQAWLPQALDDPSFADQTLQAVLSEARLKYRHPDTRVTDINNHFSFAPKITQLVLKAPNLTYSSIDIAHFKKPVSIIYAIRDPRAVVSSMLTLSHIHFVENQLKLIKEHPELMNRFHDDLVIMADTTAPLVTRNAHLWKVKSSLYNDFVKLDIPSSLCRYEALITNKKTVCKDITQQLMLPFDDLMLAHHLIYKGIAQGKTDRSRSIDKTSLQKWQANTTQDDLDRIRAAVGQSAIHLGYPLHNISS